MAAFLADVSHQIRTPLTALNLLGSQLADPSLSPDKRRTASRELRRQLDRLDWLVNALPTHVPPGMPAPWSFAGRSSA
ncbi:MAG: histidine kinase dimerization/phospho-acceptor domain-containing protein [Oscillospiraceae bacterium]